ncbi:tyrosine-protein phosphatase [Streptomyces sp. MST-110588]|uniref:tyrosine-protein phosphatase n=1 Tax=Streptomyces sp. MST-110588 TaxID=2833628 RepID=UPI001F5D54FC|nr:tyrosine-protein phosphatase [Streptomyces sp. MST-110588]UNO40759.1 tyrosine-protein phosphatase [Streptomyces sp. MST-110588]
MPTHIRAFSPNRRQALAGIGAAVLGLAVGAAPAARAARRPATAAFPPDDPRARFVDVDGAFNVRDVGGWKAACGGTIHQRTFFRGSTLSRLSDTGVTQLAALKLSVDVNFLSRAEVDKGKPDRLPAGVRTVPAPVEDPGGGHTGGFDTTKPDAGVLEEFRGYVTSAQARGSFGLAVREVAALDGKPFYLHCNSGTYRTGWATAVLMTALGVDRAQVDQEFLLSNLTFGTTYAWTEYLDAAFQQADTSFGSFGGYLSRGLGVRDADLRRLRRSLLG